METRMLVGLAFAAGLLGALGLSDSSPDAEQTAMVSARVLDVPEDVDPLKPAAALDLSESTPNVVADDQDMTQRPIPTVQLFPGW